MKLITLLERLQISSQLNFSRRAAEPEVVAGLRSSANCFAVGACVFGITGSPEGEKPRIYEESRSGHKKVQAEDQARNQAHLHAHR